MNAQRSFKTSCEMINPRLFEAVLSIAETRVGGSKKRLQYQDTYSKLIKATRI